MDETKQPGILFENVIIPEVKFKRKPEITESPKMSISINTSQKIIDKNKLQYIIDFYINKETKNPEVFFYCKIVGLFTAEEDANMTLEEFAKFNAPALLYPYIRELLYNLTIRSGINPIILPPLNLKALIKNKKQHK